MDYKAMAEKILAGVGGVSNVSMLTHCATRLRFNLVDDKIADTDAIQKISGVSGVSNRGGQYQVIIGSDVGEPYQELLKMGVNGGDKPEAKAAPKVKKGLLTTFVDTLSGIFTPILPAITGAGMMKALLALFPLIGINTGSETYQLVSIIADGAYYFLPMLLAWSAAKKFEANPCLAIALAGMLLHPNLISLMTDKDMLHLFGLPVKSYTYSYTVIPIILIVWIMSYVEKWAYKHIPTFLRFFLAPLIVFVVTGTIGLVVLGPIGGYLGDLLVLFTNFLMKRARLFTLVFFGVLQPLIVLTGAHHGFTPITIATFATYGCDPILYPASLASNMSQAGSAFAVALRAKDKDVRSQAGSAGLTALMGITEPALFGVNLRYKKPLYACMISGGVAALFAGLTGVAAYANATPGLASIAMFIGPNPMNIVFALLTIVVAVAVSFVLTLIFGGDYLESAQEEEAKIKVAEDYDIKSPIKGKVVPLSEVPDDTFASGMLGDGVAIIPSEGVVSSPVYGTVTSVFDTQHAIGLQGVNGEEILIHIGLDTVTLNGEPFRLTCKAGDKVKAGEVLGKFYINRIKDAGLNPITPVIITNPGDFKSIDFLTGKKVGRGDPIMTVHRELPAKKEEA